ncbi:hypothetical protein [Rubinisphaera sp. JC750]|uniref:hypothetical protein n=1 Tax=Rubinisphaera sp. JC750 TaxID=2898658 RepID=UPI001F451F3A|nr:hypothetical protein [Rubinisphaera sp. JC750]
MAVRLTERVGDWRADSQVDRSERLVRNVALAGLESRNGYRYSEASLREATRLYEGKPVFLDHARPGVRPQERSTRDLVGAIENVRFEEGRLRGDIDVLDTESGRTFLALAAAEHGAVGMSHVVLARRSQDRQLVEAIEEVISVDAVVFPATTQSLREQTEAGKVPSERMPGSFEDTLALLDAVIAEHSYGQRVATFVAHVVTDSGAQLVVRKWTRDDEGAIAIQETTTPVTWDELQSPEWHDRLRSGEKPETAEQLRQLQQKYQQVMREREASERTARLIEEAGLPADAVSECFRRGLEAIGEESRQRELIAERMQWWRGRRETAPRSVQRSGTPTTENTDAFVRAVRRR